jgi:hypothetical protein
LCLRNKVNLERTSGRLLNDWLNLIEPFYQSSKIEQGDLSFEELSKGKINKLNGSYLYFRTFISKIDLKNDLRFEFFFKGNNPGRYYYGAVFSKINWHPKEMNTKTDTWALNPKEHFNIHFEPQFSVLKEEFNIYLHYEVNPYQTVNAIKKHVDEHEYKEYLDKRDCFKKKLKDKKLSLWSFSNGGTNQIAKLTLNVKNYKVKDASEEISKVFQETSEAIDNVLSDMSA